MTENEKASIIFRYNRD